MFIKMRSHLFLFIIFLFLISTSVIDAQIQSQAKRDSILAVTQAKRDSILAVTQAKRDSILASVRVSSAQNTIAVVDGDTTSSSIPEETKNPTQAYVPQRPQVLSRRLPSVLNSTPEEIAREILIGVSPGIMEFPQGKVDAKLREFRSANSTLKTLIARYSPERVIKAFPNFHAASYSVRISPKTGRQVVLNDYSRIYKLRFPPGTDIKAICNQLGDLPGVSFAEPNGIFSPHVTPNDPFFLGTSHPGPQWNLGRVRMQEAWDLTQGSSSTIIAILDGGIHSTDPEFVGKLTGDSGMGAAGNIWHEHGSMVASVAAANTNNGAAIAGVDWNATILSKRIDPGTDFVAVANKILEAISDGADITNFSAGRTEEVAVVRKAFGDAYKAGLVNVTSMGNENSNAPVYPAAYQQRMLSIGATGEASNNPHWVESGGGSNWGPHIDIAAPGDNIPAVRVSQGSTYYDRVDGTSFSSPMVSGTAGLMLAYYKELFNEDLTNEDVYEVIKRSAMDIQSVGFDETSGYGLLDARNALDMLTPPYVLLHHSSIGGSDVGTTNLTMTLYEIPGLADGVYTVKRHEIRKTINFGMTFSSPPSVWGNPSSVGFSAANPNYGLPWCSPVSGTITTTGCEMKTYVYEVFTPSGQFAGWFPSIPSQVVMDYTVHGIQNNAFVNGNMEDGNGSNLVAWTATGPWSQDNTFRSNNNLQEVGSVSSHCVGTHNPESGTGTLTSNSFIICKPYINLRVCGHNGSNNALQDNKVELQVLNGGWSTTRRVFTPGSDDFIKYTWDVSEFMGMEAKVVCTDGNAGGGWAWLGVDGVVQSDAAAATPSGNVGGGAPPAQEIVNGSFDNGLTSWNATGSWQLNGAWTLHNGYPQPGQMGNFAGSFPPESGTGTLTSTPFVINKTYVNFRIGGQDNTGNSNKVKLVVGGSAVLEVGAPGDNGFIDVSWNVSNWNGQTATIECVDNNSNGGSAWFCVDEFRLDDNPPGGGGGGTLANGDFESGNLSSWNPSGPWAINNTWPLHNPQHGPQLGLQGSYCAGTNQQESQTGTMTSNNFVIDQNYLNFKIGGHDGQNNDDGHNKVELRLASNNSLLLSERTPGTNDLIQKSWNVSNWSGQTVYIACIDNHSGGGHAWISVDDFKLSGGVAKPTVTPVFAAVGAKSLPDSFGVAQNVPNPFNPETTIAYALPKDAEVRVVIYNALGQPIRTLVNDHKAAGRHRVVWDSRDDFGRQVASGLYLYQIVAGEFAETKKMLILK